MTADLFRALCEQNSLHCITQELINWRSRRLIDCFSLFVRDGSEAQSTTRVWRNPNFMREAAQIRRSAQSAERVAAFLEHRAAAVSLNPSLQTSDKTIR